MSDPDLPVEPVEAPDLVKAKPGSEGPRRVMALASNPKEGIHEHIDPAAISEGLAHEGSLIWVDITAPTQEDVQMLDEEFDLHPLALEEVLTEHPRAKCVEFDTYYMLVMYAPGRDDDGCIHLREVVIYVGKRFLVTTHAESLPEVDECVRRWRSATGVQNGGIAAPFYAFIDTLVDGYFPILDEMAEEVDDVEDTLLVGGMDRAGRRILKLRKDLLALRRAVSGQRDALNQVLRRDIDVLDESSLIYFQSVYDHIVRVVESVDTYRDLLAGAMDMYLSVVSNRMNQVMKTLTVVSTVLMSVSLVAGVYGMNFANMPELKWRYGYFGALGTMAVISGALLVLFRRLRWI